METPPYFFPQHVRAAVEEGCHVFVAKPVAVDVPGCLSILEEGERSTRDGKVFLVDFQTRTDPFHIEAIRLVHEGALGEIGLIRAFYHDECFLDPLREKTVENLLHRRRGSTTRRSAVPTSSTATFTLSTWRFGSPVTFR